VILYNHSEYVIYKVICN